jgi:hypothetical protein
MGATLVGLLLALSILGVMLIPLLHLCSESMAELLAAGERDVAISLAKRELERIRAEGPDEERLRARGEACAPPTGSPPEQFSGGAWRTCRRPDQATDPLELRIDVYRVDPETHDAPGGEPRISLFTLVEGQAMPLAEDAARGGAIGRRP